MENPYKGVIDVKRILHYFNLAMEEISRLKREDIVAKHVKEYSKP